MPWDLIGHRWAADLLCEQIARANHRHAYLFTGPPGVGRKAMALRFAQAVNCPSPLAPGDPCLKCQTCVQIGEERHPDLVILQSEVEGGMLKVEPIRKLQHSLALAPYSAKYRIAMLLRFEEANASAANALLKTLEEPSPQVILLLTATNTDDLLPTITSRCEVVRLRPVDHETIVAGLESQHGLEPDQARLMAHLSNGRPGYALELYRDPELLSSRTAWLDDHFRLLQSDRLQRFKYAEIWSKDKAEIRAAIQVWLTLWRDVMLKCSGLNNRLTNIDRESKISEISSKLQLLDAKNMILNLEKTLSRLEKNTNLRLTAEVLLMDLPSLD